MAVLRLVLMLFLVDIHNEVLAANNIDASMVKELIQANRELQASVKEMGDRILNLEHKNNLLEERLTILEKSGDAKAYHQNSTFKHQDRRLVMTSGEPVAFLASLNAHAKEEHLGVKQNIQFDTAITNLGGHFNVNHGIFTVPRSGVYLISATILSWVDTEFHACIMVSGQRTVNIFGKGTGRHAQSTQVAVLNLKLGDTVSVENIDLADVAIWGERYTSFTGVLLYETD